MQIRENRLAMEKSPYLLQHAFNPVDWHPWGKDAFERARKEDKPIFLSIGYSTCHWCHVMERESFSDPDVAELLNSTFVCIKVDREERPDIDAVYMSVCQALTGSGGWPLTIIMTPEKKPFFAATYIPRQKQFGITGLMELVPRIDAAWKSRRAELVESGEKIVAALNAPLESERGAGIRMEILGRAYAELAARFDEVHGGFGSAPKFPSPHNLLFLLRYWKRTEDSYALEMVERTLQAMRMGGIYDQLGFGFHRYSTDAEWFVPHFEKMLYDQALMSMAYVEAFQATGRKDYARTAREIFAYVKRDMTSNDGGFCSAEDADSEGVEGKFYLWTMRDVAALLPEEEAALAIDVFSLMKEGNFISDAHKTRPGVNILRMLETLPATATRLKVSQEVIAQRLEFARKMLFEAREERVRPKKDDKILADWNGLMIAALAKGSRVLDDPRYVGMAERAADFVLSKMRDGQERLLHRYRGGEGAIPGNLDDYAFIIWGLIELYESNFESKWLREALKFAKEMTIHFWDDENGGFFFTADDAEKTLVRQKHGYDGVIPSGNSVALDVLLKLGRMTGDAGLEERADRLSKAFSGDVTKLPSAHTGFISAVDFAFGPSFEVVISGDPTSADTKEMIRALRGEFLPNTVTLLRPPGGGDIDEIAPFLKGFGNVDGKATAYVCTRRTCRLPTTKMKDMLEALGVR